LLASLCLGHALATACNCELYPIALSVHTLKGVAAGAKLPDILNGAQPGHFGWLTWTGSPGTPALVASLTPPGDSFTYVNPDNPTDHQVSVGMDPSQTVSNSRNVGTLRR
jgi:hypothetical protein